MISGRSYWPLWLSQRWNAILTTAMPASAVRLAAGLTPRQGSAPAITEASDASFDQLAFSESGIRAMTAWRRRALSPPSFSAVPVLEGHGYRGDRRRGIRGAGESAHDEQVTGVGARE